MTVDRAKRLLRDWWPALFLAMAAVMMGAMWVEVRSRADAAAQTRDRVIAIEGRLLKSGVPERLERIERSIDTSVARNRESIDDLDRRQRAIAGTIEDVLGVPVEAEPDAPAP